jgi:hypothetical protein
VPIRTNRGRAAVYRRLWGWPLRSPRHLAGTLVVFAAIVVAIGVAVPQLVGGERGERSSAAADERTSRGSGADGDTGDTAGTSPHGSTGPLPTRLTSPLATPTPDEPDPAALRVAREWAAAWVDHPPGKTIEQWLDGLRPYTTQEYLPVMASVNLANIPATAVTGEPTVTSSYTSSVEAVVPTDGPELSITLVSTNSGWKVAHYDQAG